MEDAAETGSVGRSNTFRDAISSAVSIPRAISVEELEEGHAVGESDHVADAELNDKIQKVKKARSKAKLLKKLKEEGKRRDREVEAEIEQDERRKSLIKKVQLENGHSPKSGEPVSTDTKWSRKLKHSDTLKKFKQDANSSSAPTADTAIITEVVSEEQEEQDEQTEEDEEENTQQIEQEQEQPVSQPLGEGEQKVPNDPQAQGETSQTAPSPSQPQPETEAEVEAEAEAEVLAAVDEVDSSDPGVLSTVELESRIKLLERARSKAKKLKAQQQQELDKKIELLQKARARAKLLKRASSSNIQRGEEDAKVDNTTQNNSQPSPAVGESASIPNEATATVPTPDAVQTTEASVSAEPNNNNKDSAGASEVKNEGNGEAPDDFEQKVTLLQRARTKAKLLRTASSSKMQEEPVASSNSPPQTEAVASTPSTATQSQSQTQGEQAPLQIQAPAQGEQAPAQGEEIPAQQPQGEPSESEMQQKIELVKKARAKAKLMKDLENQRKLEDEATERAVIEAEKPNEIFHTSKHAFEASLKIEAETKKLLRGDQLGPAHRWSMTTEPDDHPRRNSVLVDAIIEAPDELKQAEGEDNEEEEEDNEEEEVDIEYGQDLDTQGVSKPTEGEEKQTTETGTETGGAEPQQSTPVAQPDGINIGTEGEKKAESEGTSQKESEEERIAHEKAEKAKAIRMAELASKAAREAELHEKITLVRKARLQAQQLKHKQLLEHQRKASHAREAREHERIVKAAAEADLQIRIDKVRKARLKARKMKEQRDNAQAAAPYATYVIIETEVVDDEEEPEPFDGAGHSRTMRPSLSAYSLAEELALEAMDATVNDVHHSDTDLGALEEHLAEEWKKAAEGFEWGKEEDDGYIAIDADLASMIPAESYVLTDEQWAEIKKRELEMAGPPDTISESGRALSSATTASFAVTAPPPSEVGAMDTPKSVEQEVSDHQWKEAVAQRSEAMASQAAQVDNLLKRISQVTKLPDSAAAAKANGDIPSQLPPFSEEALSFNGQTSAPGGPSTHTQTPNGSLQNEVESTQTQTAGDTPTGGGRICTRDARGQCQCVVM